MLSYVWTDEETKKNIYKIIKEKNIVTILDSKPKKNKKKEDITIVYALNTINHTSTC